MKKWLKISVISLFALVFLVQFIRPAQNNPAIIDAATLESTTAVPANVEAILTRSCSDCHTNKTVYPWYSKVTPVNWFLAHHIDEGRQTLNFSVWNKYETPRKKRKLDQICEQATDGEMPLPSYLWIHGDARLSPEDVRALCDWTENETLRIGQKE